MIEINIKYKKRNLLIKNKKILKSKLMHINENLSINSKMIKK